MFSRRLIFGVSKRGSYLMRYASVTSKNDAVNKFREYRSLKNLDFALTKSIKTLKRKITKDVEKPKLAELSKLIESRGFEIDNKTCIKTLYLSRVAESGENILISIWKEVKLTKYHYYLRVLIL